MRAQFIEQLIANHSDCARIGRFAVVQLPVESFSHFSPNFTAFGQRMGAKLLLNLLVSIEMLEIISRVRHHPPPASACGVTLTITARHSRPVYFRPIGGFHERRPVSATTV